MILARLAALLLYAALGAVDPVGWLWVYAASSAIYAAFLARRLVAGHRPVWPQKRDWRMARESFPFTIGALSFRLQAEFNKPLLARASYGQAGSFGVAQRAVDLASLPLQAMLEALWPKFYSEKKPDWQFWLIAGILVFLALLGSVFLILVAPWLPRLLGSGFDGVAQLIVALAWLPIFQIIRIGVSAIVAKRWRHILIIVYLAGGASGVIFALWVIPCFGLRGAIWNAYFFEFFLILLLFGAFFKIKSE